MPTSRSSNYGTPSDQPVRFGYLATQFDSAWGVAVQPDAPVVASGSADAGGDPAFAVLRYQP